MAAKDVFDLDTIAVEETPFPFKFGGESFEMAGDPDVQLWEYLAKGDIQTALWLGLGDEQYKVLDELDEVLTQKRCEALLEAYGKHCGVAPGKSSGPSKSSKRTSGR